MTYHDALNYLAQKTPVIELYNQLGGRVVVCPEWNGRVLTSTCEGLDGDSFGFVDVQAIDAERFENFGGEDHWTISPLVHPFSVESIREHNAMLQRTLYMADANGKSVELHLSRSISLLHRQTLRTWFGDTIADLLEQTDVSMVGFCTENTIWSQERGYIASRQRGMFNASPHTCIIISTLPKDFTSEPFSVEIDYLSGSPHGRVRHLSDTLLLRADGHGRCRATIPFSLSPPIFGAVECRAGTLTLWTFELPDNSEGNIIQIDNSGGSPTPKPDWSAHYEINCFSPAHKLLPETPLLYNQCTLHLNADNHILNNLIQQIFNISLENISHKMRR
jgi:hypothetical protein